MRAGHRRAYSTIVTGASALPSTLSGSAPARTASLHVDAALRCRGRHGEAAGGVAQVRRRAFRRLRAGQRGSAGVGLGASRRSLHAATSAAAETASSEKNGSAGRERVMQNHLTMDGYCNAGAPESESWRELGHNGPQCNRQNWR